MTCPSCASEVPSGARFCPSCGHALQQQVDERRIVTIVFGDLVGFTAMSESLDPEQVKLLVQRCFDRLTDDVVRFGGHVDKLLGDGILALFGAPTAHEDDAERAVRAALQMQRSIAELAEGMGPDIRMRVGINSGEVLVGSMGAGDMTAMGDVVNIAQRLQTVAQPGQVVVGFETFATTQDTIHYEPLGPVHARGREAPILAWAAIEPVTAPGERPRRFGVPMVGRDVEQQLLAAAFDAGLSRRRPTLVVVSGDTGMGKTRLLREVIHPAVERHGALLFAGRALPYGETNPWGPIAEGVQSVLGIASDDPVAVVRELVLSSVASVFGSPREAPEVLRTVDGLVELLGYESAATEIDPLRAREESARAARLYLQALASRQPLLMAVGDAQWADPLVLDFVDSMLDRIHKLPLVVTVTARPELAERWQPKVGRHNVVTCALEPLDDAAASELLRFMLGRDPGAEVRRELVARSGGNPFFIEELSALLNEPGATTPALYAALPATLRGVVAARLDALPPDERAVVDDIAVLGRGPRAAVVALGAARASAAAIEGALARLVDREVVFLEDTLVEFTTDLIREVAYGTMSKAQRARRHADVASWLEDEGFAGQGAEDQLEEIARHYAAAADLVAEIGEVEGVPGHVREVALGTLQRAAERADDRELYQLAERLFDRMVDLLGEQPGAARRHALVGRARARNALHRLPLAKADLDAVEVEARDAGDDVALARALVVRGDLLRNLGDFDGSIAILDDAAALWRRIGDRRGEASALRRIGWTHLFAGDPDRAEPFIREAFDAFSEIGVKRGVAWAQQNLAWIAFLRGDVGLAESRLSESNRLFAEIGDWGGQSWGNAMLAMVMYASGRNDEAEVLAERVAADARSQGDTWSLGMMTVVLARVRLWQGRIAEAAERATDARRTFAELNDPWMLARALPPQAEALTLLGRGEEADAVVADARELVPVFSETSADRALPIVMALERATRLGEVEAAGRALGELPHEVRAAFGYEGLPLARSLALLQAGRVAEAEDAARAVLDGPPVRAMGLGALLALILAVDGRTAEAEAQASAVLGGRAVYFERTLARFALASVALRSGDVGRARRTIEEAEREVGGTEDLVLAAIVARAKALVLAAVGHGGAAEATAEADRQAAAVGSPLTGWTAALAAGLTTVTESLA